MTIEEKVHGIEVELIKIAEREKSNTIRLNEMNEVLKENNKLIGTIQEIAVETKYMREDLNSNISRIEKIESRDSESWGKFKWLIVTGLVTLILGYIAINLGLK